MPQGGGCVFGRFITRCTALIFAFTGYPSAALIASLLCGTIDLLFVLLLEAAMPTATLIRLSSKGQVVIPKSIRHQHQWHSGSSSWLRKPTTASCCAPSSLHCSPKPRCNRQQVVCNPPMWVSPKRWEIWRTPFAKGLRFTMVAVDTNIIVRFLVKNDLAQFQRAGSIAASA